ncbi:MAG: AarF/ABC1/UbiB kinase family protein [Moraxellaceae bacterium]|jgi:predicted unusual protein kinase regulating ubiquinone biosynthesis (AarF/ABC1/UbiB family)|nr:AarF/ABC1/UbiB kinase family protein [Moraxellaceae bacterium]
MSDNPHQMKRLKTGAFERRLSLAKAGFIASTRFAAGAAGSMFASPEERDEKRRRMMAEQAQYLVRELGKLKGSVVKIGQMMALYGEHFLPEEITRALHQLNDDTTALAWASLEPVVRAQLGDKRFNELEIDPEPLGAASLAQVHRAKRKADGCELVLKIQYPGVAQAIDSDLNLVTQMLRLTKAVPQTREFEEWLDEVRMMMHREVNYPQEAETTRLFYSYLRNDERFIVPRIFPEYCTDTVLCMSFERGVAINSPIVLQLPQERRNRIAEAALDICCREVFEWGEIQTDPNFGNYLVRLAEKEGDPDRIVLLDFGAVRDFPDDLLELARKLSRAAFYKDRAAMQATMQGFPFFANMPQSVQDSLTELFFLAIEPFSDLKDAPPEALTSDGHYDWAKGKLHARVATFAAKSAATRHFAVPPKEVMFISRKFMGAYTFMTVIGAQIYARALLEPYLKRATP